MWGAATPTSSTALPVCPPRTADRGSARCAVHNTEQEPKVVFTEVPQVSDGCTSHMLSTAAVLQFQMRLLGDGQPLPIAEVKARRPSRQRLHPSEYAVAAAGVSSTKEFGGTLELLSLWSVAGQQQ